MVAVTQVEAAKPGDKVEIESTKVIAADSQIVDALANIGYSIESAVADLVSNSIDARMQTTS